MGRGFWKPQARLGPPTAVNTFFRTVETVKTGRGRGGGRGESQKGRVSGETPPAIRGTRCDAHVTVLRYASVCDAPGVLSASLPVLQSMPTTVLWSGYRYVQI